MAPSLQVSSLMTLISRDATPDEQDAENKKLTPTLIGGIVVACILAASVIVWAIVRYIRKRASATRQDDRGAAFLNVRGLKQDGNQTSGGLTMNGTLLFSKDNMTESVIMPEKAGSRQEIIDQYSAEGKLPRPFAPFMTNGGKLSTSSGDDDNTNSKRNSTASWISMGRNSFWGNKSSHRASTASFASTVSSLKLNDKRKIRQVFTPVLPDELVISLGEQLTVVNSYDDGWCIVGRDSVFKPGEVELGAIPAWCFMKAVQGLRAERPMRTTSLGVTVTLDAEPGTRDEVMSWSNF